MTGCGAFEECAAFLRRDRLHPDNHIEGPAAAEDADSAIRLPTMADAIVDRNGNIIIDLP
jgi:hypothetical protein